MRTLIPGQDDQVTSIFAGTGSTECNGAINTNAKIMPGCNIDRDATRAVKFVEGSPAPMQVTVYTINSGRQSNYFVIANQPALRKIRVIAGVNPPFIATNVSRCGSGLTTFTWHIGHIDFIRDYHL